MGMTMTQKILAAHCGEAAVTAGQLINAQLDIVLGNDITTPVAINEFEKAGFDSVFDRTRVNIVLDHFVPNKDIKSATQSKQCRQFADKYDILNFYDVGEMGVEHALLPEKGIVTAGDCIIGADSHTCTYGAVGAFSTGVGSTDMAAGMAKGVAWFKVPAAIKVTLKGKLQPHVSGKDVILELIGRMIENTRSRMVRNSGRPLLAWGYATVLTTLIVWGAVVYFQDPRWNYLWLMLPLLGWLLMWISREKKPEGEVRTFVDRVIGNVWTVMGLSAWFVSMLALFTPMRLPILFIILLIMGMGTTVTGLIIRFTPTAVGGVAAIILAPFTLIAGNMWQPLLFIAGFVVMMIVPGHILNYKSNHPAR